MGVRYRLSTQDDSEDIRTLVKMCFCERDYIQYLKQASDLDGRFLLAFDGCQLVAMSGLIYSREYKAFEINYSCVILSHRGRGIMTKMVELLCSLTDDKIYCSSWRTGDKIHMHRALKSNGFKEVMRDRVKYDKDHNCHYRSIIAFGHSCKCSEDLWIREAT